MPSVNKYEDMSALTALKYAKNRNLLLPDIQREYVWEISEIERLFESVVDNYPIGSCIFWKTNRKIVNTKKPNLYYFINRNNKSTIIFNNSIKIENIPLEVYNYKINGLSPIEWVIDQYQVSVDKDFDIVNDPNKFNKEKRGKYVFDLILSLITVSLETLKLIDELQPYEEIE